MNTIKPILTAAGIIRALPWKDRFRIKSRALWSLCPASVRGALVWTALSPMIWTALVLLTRLDAVGRSPMTWGGWQAWVMLWLPSIVLSVCFLPASRGIVALRRGGLWVEYSAALKGVDPISGELRNPRFADWAFFTWIWILSVFISWLDERALREVGATFGHSISWHVLNVARLEICMFIFATAAAGWLSKSRVFQKMEGNINQVTHGNQSSTDWSKLGSALREIARVASHGWGLLIIEESRRWVAAKKSSSSTWSTWCIWFGGSSYVIRAGLMSTATTLTWWLSTWLLSQWFDADWQVMTIGFMSGWKFLVIAALCALLTRIVSRRDVSVLGSALWFGPGGPTAIAWTRMFVVSVITDRVSIWIMSMPGFCVEPRLAGGGLLLVVITWVCLVFLGEALGWVGSIFALWDKQARAQGAIGLESYAKVAIQAISVSWHAAGVAKAQLGRAVEEKAMKNEEGLAQILRKELEAAASEAPKRGRGPSRL